MEDEIQTMTMFVRGFRLSDAIPEMEDDLTKAIAYGQRVGELVNEAERDYRVKFAEALNELGAMDEETETTRKAKLEAMTADARLLWQNLKNLNTHLKAARMSLMQAIKTRRDEPRSYHGA